MNKFSSATKIESKINSIQDLANQDDIAYGVLSSGTTYDFFREATIPLYQKMFQAMTNKQSYSTSTTAALQRVRSGGYAYLTDEPVLQYKHQRRPCNTFLLRNLLMAKGYGLGLQLNSEWTQLFSVRILKVSNTARYILLFLVSSVLFCILLQIKEALARESLEGQFLD